MKLERLDAVKIDVEGGEGAVIEGMHESLTSLRPRFVVVELKDAHYNRARANPRTSDYDFSRWATANAVSRSSATKSSNMSRETAPGLRAVLRYCLREGDSARLNLEVSGSARDRLRHVRWIGGGTGAGKSTIARRLAAENGLGIYSSDETISDHARRSSPSDHPLLHRFQAMNMDERWVSRTPEVMLDTFHGFQGEAFELIIEDLLKQPDDAPILAEGFRLLPRLVAPLLNGPRQAVWLLPTPAFRRTAFEARGFTWEIPRKTSDPERALVNLLARDELFTALLVSEAATLQLPVIEVDVDRPVEDVLGEVGIALGLSRPQGR